MKKHIGFKVFIVLAVVLFANVFTVQAVDFTANADITVSEVTFSGSNINMTILSGSTATSWTISGGTFTVTDPGPAFKVSTSNTSVKMITATLSGNRVVCIDNSTPGTSSLTLPTGSGTYTVVPSASSPCNQPVVFSSPASTPASSPASTPTTPPPTTTPPETTPLTETIPPPMTAAERAENIASEAQAIGEAVRADVLSSFGKERNIAAEAKYERTVVKQIITGAKNVTTAVKEKLVTFVTYGTPTTEKLGAGERAGVVSSFKSAFGKVPQNTTDWEDVVKIANGRWPSQTSKTKETAAERSFRTIYKRAPDRANPKDDAAVVVMAYGLRPANRNMAAEQAAIRTYRAIFKRSPTMAAAWDTVRAIAYSGARR